MTSNDIHKAIEASLLADTDGRSFADSIIGQLATESRARVYAILLPIADELEGVIKPYYAKCQLLRVLRNTLTAASRCRERAEC